MIMARQRHALYEVLFFENVYQPTQSVTDIQTWQNVKYAYDKCESPTVSWHIHLHRDLFNNSNLL